MKSSQIAELLNEPACSHKQKEKSGCARPKPGATAGGCSFDGAQIALLPVADVAHSFTFQVPLSDLLTGQTDSVAISTARRLPLAAAERLSCPRKLPARRNIDEICSFLLRVERNELPSLVTIRAVANRLGIHERELSRILPDDGR